MGLEYFMKTKGDGGGKVGQGYLLECSVSRARILSTSPHDR